MSITEITNQIVRLEAQKAKLIAKEEAKVQREVERKRFENLREEFLRLACELNGVEVKPTPNPSEKKEIKKPARYGVVIQGYDGAETLYFSSQYASMKVRDVLTAWQGKAYLRSLRSMANVISKGYE